MKAAYLTGLAFFSALPCCFAQEAKPRLALTIGLVNNYDVVLKNGPVANHYSLGSKINAVFNDAWFVGYSQLNSMAPKNVIKIAGIWQAKIGVSEYALVGGRKWSLSPKAYALTSVRVGVSQLVWRNDDELSFKDDQNIIQELRKEFDDTFGSDRRRSSFMGGVEAGLGFKLSQHWGLEASANYRQHFRDEKLIVETRELNRIGFAISAVGTINLK
jgi:hypothetical protein